MSAAEISDFSQLWAYHPPTAIGAFLIFVIIFRSKFFAHKAKIHSSRTSLNLNLIKLLQ